MIFFDILYVPNRRLYKKPLLFRSFTGLTIPEFESQISREIELKYEEYERRRLSKGRGKEMLVQETLPFKLKARERLLMLLVYYRLYITYTLSGFLFDFY